MPRGRALQQAIAYIALVAWLTVLPLALLIGVAEEIRCKKSGTCPPEEEYAVAGDI